MTQRSRSYLDARIRRALQTTDADNVAFDDWLDSCVLKDETSPVFNVESYGASTSSDDNSEAFNAAIAAAVAAGGGTVFVPEGTYITDYIDLDDSVTLQGAGRGATIIKLKDSATSHCIRFVGTTADVQVLDLTVDGNKANQSSTHSCIAHATTPDISRARVHNVECKNAKGYGFYFSNDNDAQHGNLWAYDNDIDGFYINGNNNAVQSVLSHGSGHASVGFGEVDGLAIELLDLDGSGTVTTGDNITAYAENTANVVIGKAICRNSGNHGIHAGGTNWIIGELIIIDPAESGVYLKSSAGVTTDYIVGSIVAEGCGGDGIELLDCDRVAIGKVLLTGCTGSGINAIDCTDISVFGGAITNNGGKGIRFAGVQGWVLRDQQIHDNTGEGVALLAGTGSTTDGDLSGCTIHTNSYGVNEAGGGNNRIHDNTIYSNTTSDFVNINSTTRRYNNHVGASRDFSGLDVVNGLELLHNDVVVAELRSDKASLGGARGAESLSAYVVANAVNWLAVRGGTTGNSVKIAAESGTDTDVDLEFQPRGAGKMKILLTKVPTYADDAAAGSGGLSAGQIYKTSAGVLAIKL